jgi:hypothetical protein
MPAWEVEIDCLKIDSNVKKNKYICFLIKHIQYENAYKILNIFE